MSNEDFFVRLPSFLLTEPRKENEANSARFLHSAALRNGRVKGQELGMGTGHGSAFYARLTYSPSCRLNAQSQGEFGAQSSICPDASSPHYRDGRRKRTDGQEWDRRHTSLLQGWAKEKEWSLGCVDSPPAAPQREPGGGIHAT